MNVIAALYEIISYQVLGLSVFMYLGIFALLFLLLTAYLAKNRKPKGFFMKWHHYMVGLSLFLALLHAVSGILVTRLIGDTNNQYHSDNKLMKSPEIVAGQKIFSEICSGCHKNGGNIINLNLPIKGSHKLANYETFLSFIRDPRMPDGSTGAMPPFPESRISNDETKKLYKYLVSEIWLWNLRSSYDHTHRHWQARSTTTAAASESAAPGCYIFFLLALASFSGM